MSSRRRGAASLTGILLALACNDNPFEPLYQACADEMAKVRSDYVNTPSREDRVTLSDGRFSSLLRSDSSSF